MELRIPPQRYRAFPSLTGLALTMALLAFSLVTLGLLVRGNPPASAAPATELHVCPSGCAYSAVQAAVDAANTGDLIKVAAGTYTGVESRPAPPGYLSGPPNIDQVVYLNKTLTIQGGYTASDWTVPDPEANPTILDAQGQGRVLFVFGEVSPTIAGLHLSGGDASGLGGHPWAGGSNTGGAVNVLTATATIRDCWVYESSADFGGGIYLDRSESTVQNTEVTTNTANWGGGISLRMSGAQILDNTIAGNTVVASGSGVPSAGGGMDVGAEQALIPPILIQGNTITGNQADHQGGGLSCSGDADATVNANLITANTAITGGGVYLWENYVELTGNTISANTAEHGGGVAIDEGAAILEGNTLVDNTATGDGGGAFIQFEHYQGVGPTVTGNTFEGNQAGSGGGLATRNADVLIRDNTFSGNLASGGGGMDLFGSSDTLVANNLVSGNTAGSGAGIGVGMFDGTLEGNRIVSNVASGDGGGLVVFGGGTWANNVIADNQAGGRGSALFMKQGQLELRHTTIARNTNTGADDSALYLTDESPVGGQSEATLINTILVDHSTGIRVTAGNTATVDAVLWYNTPTTVDAQPGASVSLQNEYTGDPAFAVDGYHLTAGSAALDKGIDVGVNVDIDADPRPMLAGYDLGADEFVYKIYLPLTLRSHRP
jgi:hypothetical protein